MCWASSTAHSWKSINSAGERGEEKGRGEREEGESGKQSLKAWTSTPGQAGSCHRALRSPAPPCSGLPAQQPCPLLWGHLSAGQPPPEQLWEGTDQGRRLWGGGVRFASSILLTINLYLMTYHQEMTKQPPQVSCPQDTDQLTLLSPGTNNFARVSQGNQPNVLPGGKGP